jgi:hypothetical protein
LPWLLAGAFDLPRLLPRAFDCSRLIASCCIASCRRGLTRWTSLDLPADEPGLTGRATGLLLGRTGAMSLDGAVHHSPGIVNQSPLSGVPWLLGLELLFSRLHPA